jgi:predicted nucleic acid-binding protein
MTAALFVDTSALYAVLDADDGNHARARGVWTDSLSDGTRLITSNYVLVETTALLQHRIGLEAVRALAETVMPVLEVRWLGHDEHQAAMLAVLAANRRGLSLVECTSFEVMRHLGLRTAFAFGTHFAEQGFELTPIPSES